MRLAAAAVVLSAGAITSAQLSSIPQCSLSCLTSALGADGCSELTDFACHCQKTGLVEQVVPCVKQACDVKDQQAVSSVVVSLCSGAGHPVSVPPVDSSAPTSTAAGRVPTTTSSSSNSTTVSGLGGSPRTSSAASKTSTVGSTTSSTVNTASPSSTSLSNGASGIGSGAAQVAGTAILLASMMFLV
ncbi:hypothetical protein IFM51744_11095 [Aspergillus udagawae]|uniref:CFEM domain-containing protein n=1 Tax=Aspergillus udagawae TaxID=91492 RepID=A0ABQ1BDZ2_9EURO|nr:hypothetical protein IFM51744_11095 [Aspergillus udagawae]GFF99597.1 hypothetical protein IFM53868_10367 [Aspergillus udagawae]